MNELTDRERQTVTLRLALGLSTKQTAAEMGLQPSTVKQYMHSAYAKLGPAQVSRMILPAMPGESPK
jgi:DNA-binding NarL/FixJ family response regulator